MTPRSIILFPNSSAGGRLAEAVARPIAGTEWIVDAAGCRADALRDRPLLDRLFRRIVESADLHPIGPPRWHEFEGTGGVTGFLLLSESHLAVHTFPEFGTLCLNLFCCKPRTDPAWEELLSELGDDVTVSVRRVKRRLSPEGSKSRC